MSSKFQRFESKLEKDQANSDVLMLEYIESERIEKERKLEHLRNKLIIVKNKLAEVTNANAEKKIIDKAKRDVSLTELDIKSLTGDSFLKKKEELKRKKRDEWHSINVAVKNNKDETAMKMKEYYLKKNANEMTDDDIIDVLLVEPEELIRQTPSMDEMQGTSLDMDKYITAVDINKDHYYDDVFTDLKGIVLTEFEDESLAFQTGMPTDKIIPRPANMNSSIERVFEKILPVQKTFYVYRCYYSDVSVDLIDKQRRVGRPLSTSLSYNYSYEWACNERSNHKLISNTDTGNIMICIIIPKGTHVIPLHHYLQKYEYEVLLSSEGKLCFTGKRDPVHGLPVFIYFDSHKQCNKYKMKKSLIASHKTISKIQTRKTKSKSISKLRSQTRKTKSL